MYIVVCQNKGYVSIGRVLILNSLFVIILLYLWGRVAQLVRARH